MITREIENGYIQFDPNFLEQKEADHYYTTLRAELPWKQGHVKLFGKVHPTPRLESFHGEDGLTYSYSGNTLAATPFTPELRELKERIEAITQKQFNCVLVNFYRDGKDSNGWHADDEKELGQDPLIASVSLGVTRRFDLRHIKNGHLLHLDLNHGSLLIMGGALQHFWKHRIGRSQKISTGRINLTFRYIIND